MGEEFELESRSELFEFFVKENGLSFEEGIELMMCGSVIKRYTFKAESSVGSYGGLEGCEYSEC